MRKAATNPEHSESLRLQAERQRDISRRLAGVAAVPEVLNEGMAEGCYWFDMEYVVGTDAVRYLRVGTPDRVEALLVQVCAVLDKHAKMIDSHAPPIFLQTRVFDKLDEIDLRTSFRYRLVTDSIRAKCDDIDFALTPNFAHGDLTLENIIVDRRQHIWLIDTIPSPFDHYWIDLAKLFQDLEGRWFQRRGGSLSVGLTWTLRERLMAYALALDPNYSKAHPVLLALTFARILPYCVTPADIRFVEAKVFAAIDVIKSE